MTTHPLDVTPGTMTDAEYDALPGPRSESAPDFRCTGCQGVFNLADTTHDGWGDCPVSGFHMVGEFTNPVQGPRALPRRIPTNLHPEVAAFIAALWNDA